MSEDNKTTPVTVDKRRPVSPDAARNVESILDKHRAQAEPHSDPKHPGEADLPPALPADHPLRHANGYAMHTPPVVTGRS